jgi:hypothetical protein
MRVQFRALGLFIALFALVPTLSVPPAGAAAKQSVSIVLGSASVKIGQTAHINGKVSPAAAGKQVRLQRFYGKAWHGYKAQTLTKKSTYDFGVSFTKKGAYKLRVAAPSAFSKTVTLTVVPPRSGPPIQPA